MSTMVSVVDDVRGFNRFYTRVLGLLRPDLAGSPFGLTEARVLFELAHRDDVAVSDLRRELDLDAGYLSRILSGFTASGLVAREQSATDGRRQVVRLTADGRAAFAELDRLQATAIDALLAPLDEGQRSQLVAAMGQIRRVLDGRTAAGRSGPPRAGAGRSRLGRRAPRRPLRRRLRLGCDVRGPGRAHRRRLRRPPRHQPRGGVDRRAGRRTGRLRVLHRRGHRGHRAAAPAARRAVGARLRASAPDSWTSACDSPSDPATRESRLWTNDVLVAARRIYERAGFQRDRREPHHSFGHDLVGEYWSRDL